MGYRDRWQDVMVVSAIFLAMACTEPKKKTTVPVLVSTHDANLAASMDADATASNLTDAGDSITAASSPTRTISLVGKAPTQVPESDISVYISGSSHKTRAPVADVSILVSRGEKQAELTWRITSGGFDSTWMMIAGQRWDGATNAYIEEEIPGWQVKLESVDAQSVGGNPTAITISFQPTP